MNNKYNDKKGRYEIRPITIETVDRAIFDYYDKKLSLTVDAQNERRKVPIIYASGERWKLIRKNKFQDENGTLILPVVSINRTSIDRTPGFGGLGQEVNSITVSKQIHKKTGLYQNLLRQRKINNFPEVKKDAVVYEYLTIPFPDFATVYYEVTVWTQFQTQMNEMLEKIFYSFDYRSSFVMPIDYDTKSKNGIGSYFVGFCDTTLTPDTNVKEFTDQERIFKYALTIKVPAHFILSPKDDVLSYGRDRENKGTNVVYKTQSATRLELKEKTVTLEDFEKLYE